MNLEIKDIEDLAILARLDLREDEKERYAEQLSAVFGYIGMLREVNTENVPETCQVTGLLDVTRDDIAILKEDETRKKLIAAFPEKRGDLLKVKAVFKKDI